MAYRVSLNEQRDRIREPDRIIRNDARKRGRLKQGKKTSPKSFAMVVMVFWMGYGFFLEHAARFTRKPVNKFMHAV